jgi:hypothetical protein
MDYPYPLTFSTRSVFPSMRTHRTFGWLDPLYPGCA